MLFAVKRLSQVEVAPRATTARVKAGSARSNQHEFNAGRLRTSLGINKDSVSSSLKLLFFLADDEDPIVEEGQYTVYNAREGKPRSAEYRLYYTSGLVTELARPGDLFVVFRPKKTHELIGIVIRAGIEAEREILEALRVDPKQALNQFVPAEPAPLSKAGVATLIRPSAVRAVTEPAFSHPLLAEAVERRKIPQPAVIAGAASQSIVAHFGDLPADRFITESLRYESELFFAIEAAVKDRELQFLIGTGQASLDRVLSFTLSIQQSRKARRGLSLQFHFEALLKRERIPFSPQCKTEHGETPDIVVPGQRQYANRKFPSEFLRLVACKTTVRERWGQVLREADRIEEKYLLTVDGAMSDEVINNMRRYKLLPFVPAQVREAAYAYRADVETVEQLLGRLRSAVDQARHSGNLS